MSPLSVSCCGTTVHADKWVWAWIFLALFQRRGKSFHGPAHWSSSRQKCIHVPLYCPCRPNRGPKIVRCHRFQLNTLLYIRINWHLYRLIQTLNTSKNGICLPDEYFLDCFARMQMLSYHLFLLHIKISMEIDFKLCLSSHHSVKE